MDNRSSNIEKHITRWKFVYLAAYTALYFGGIGYIASVRPLWLDEIFTLYISRLNVTDMWRTLAAGADNNPPLYYILAGLSTKLPGNAELGVRIPSIFAFWGATLCMYAFVKRDRGPLIGFIAMLVPFATAAGYYAFEARPYAILLFFSALALLMWQRIEPAGSHRRFFVVMLGVALFAAASSHYYGFLVAVPVIAGESLRTVRRRHVDTGVLAAMAAIPLALILYLPLIRAASGFSGIVTWNRATAASMSTIYKDLFVGLITPAALFVFCYCVLPRTAEADPQAKSEPSSDRVAAAAFLLLPVAGFVVALITKALVYRYVIETVVGAGCLIALLVDESARKRRFLAIVCLFSLVCYVPLAVRSQYRASEYLFSPQLRDLIGRLLREQPDPLVLDKFHYPSTAHYTQPAGYGRVFALHGSQHYMSDTELSVMSRVAPFQIVPMRSFIHEHRSFLVVIDEEGLMQDLLNIGCDIQIYAFRSGVPVFRVVRR